MKPKEPLTNTQQLDILLSMAAIFGGAVLSSLTDSAVYKNVLMIQIVLGLVWLVLTIIFYYIGKNRPKLLAVILRTVLVLLLLAGGAYLILGHDLYQDKLTH